MREVVLDTETTGFDPAEGHRMVEVGCVEVLDRERLGDTFHRHINPQRHVPREASAVHGLSQARLFREPPWKGVEGEFLSFIGDSPLVAHNAKFDRAFVEAEVGRELPNSWFDTMSLAPTSLDQLAKKYQIEAERKVHGALKDALLLAHVYIRLRRPAQASFGLSRVAEAPIEQAPVRPRPAPLAPRLTDDEKEAHKAFIKSLGVKAVWLDY
jgi:DNA polymerase-3 subunit epsilon